MTLHCHFQKGCMSYHMKNAMTFFHRYVENYMPVDVGNKANKPPTILQSKVRPRIMQENGAKILVMWPQAEDTPRIPDADGQGRMKKKI